MIAEIIAIGSEVVSGKTMDSNSSYLAKKLTNMGINVYYHTSVDDSPERLKKVFEIALDRSDLVITCGGLGPTKDDMSKEVLADVLKLDLEYDQDMLDNIKEKFQTINRPLTINNNRQAMKLSGSIFLDNQTGTAPGIYLEKDNKKIIMLPGPPRELKTMFEGEVIKHLKSDKFVLIESINTIGLGESMTETILLDMDLKRKNTDIATFAKEGMVEIRIVSQGYDHEIIKEEYEYNINLIKENLKDYIFGYGNIKIEEAVINLLRKNNYKLGLCESCTGGLVSSKITSISGSSDVFDCSLVTYSNEAKMAELNVNKNTLDEYGAVSKQTAYEMAKGLMDKRNLDIVVSITGIAGPNSDDTNKPVGLVYICVMTKDHYKVVKSNFFGTRKSIQNKTTMKVFELIRNELI